MGSFLDAPADAIALQQLAEATSSQPARLKLRHLFGARALTQPGGYWLDHAAAVRIVARQLRRLVRDGYMVIPQLRVPGTQDELLDFLVISPRGSVYAIIAHQFNPNRVRLTRNAVMSGGHVYAYPGDLRAKAHEISLRLGLRDYPHTEVIPMLVAVNTAWLTTRGSGLVRGATDSTLVPQIRKREARRMRLGFDVLPRDARVFEPGFWQDERVFEPDAYARHVRTYRTWRWISTIANWASVLWTQLAFSLLAGGILAVLYYASGIDQLPNLMILLPPN